MSVRASCSSAPGRQAEFVFPALTTSCYRLFPSSRDSASLDVFVCIAIIRYVDPHHLVIHSVLREAFFEPSPHFLWCFRPGFEYPHALVTP